MGIEYSIPHIKKSLSTTESLPSKTYLVKLLAIHLLDISFPPQALAPLVETSILIIGDKNANIRRIGEHILIIVMDNTGADIIHKASLKLKQAEQNKLFPIFEKVFQIVESMRIQGKIPRDYLSNSQLIDDVTPQCFL